jgi:hypothetical protein
MYNIASICAGEVNDQIKLNHLVVLRRAFFAEAECLAKDSRNGPNKILNFIWEAFTSPGGMTETKNLILVRTNVCAGSNSDIFR